MLVGSIIKYNNQFGFIQLPNSDTIYFHKTALFNSEKLEIGDKVEFETEPSPKKQGSLQAKNIKLIEKCKEIIINDLPKHFGIISHWNTIKDIGFVKKNNQEYFFHISAFNGKFVKEKEYVVFNLVQSKKYPDKQNAINIISIKAVKDLDFLIIEYLKNSYSCILEQIKLLNPTIDYLNEIINKLLNSKNLLKIDEQIELIYSSLILGENFNLDFKPVLLEFDFDTLYKIFDKFPSNKRDDYLLFISEQIKEINSTEKFQQSLKIINFLKRFYYSNIDKFINNYYQISNSEFKFQWFQNDYVKTFDNDFVLQNLLTFNIQTIEKILNTIDNDLIINVIDNIIKNRQFYENIKWSEYIVLILKVLKKRSENYTLIFISKIIPLTDDLSLIELWLSNHISFIEDTKIIQNINSLSLITLRKILEKKQDNLNLKIFDKIVHEFIINQNSYNEHILLILKYLQTNNIDLFNSYLLQIIPASNDLFKIELWFAGYYNDLDIRIIQTNILRLNRNLIFKIWRDYDEITKEEIIKKVKNDLSLNIVDISTTNTFFSALNEIMELNLFNILVVEILSLLPVETRFKFFEDFVKVFLLKPEKNKFAGWPLIKLIGIETAYEISYVKNNRSLFPTEYQVEISKFYDLTHSYGYYSYSTYVRSKYFINKIETIKYLLNCDFFNTNCIIDYYTNCSILKLDINKTIRFLAAYKEIKELLKIENDFNYIKTILNKIIVEIPLYFKKILIDFSQDKSIAIEILNGIKTIDRELFNDNILSVFNESEPSMKLLLWVHDFVELDFNQYFKLFSFYYFTLNNTERKLFNKKARLFLGNELKKSLLKERVPWIYCKTNENEVDIYSASWRSIWFLDDYIQICKDTDYNFTKPFKCEFSEEKFNLLTDYISGRRLNDLEIFAYKGNVLKINGLEELEEIIWKAQIQKEIETGEQTERKQGKNKIPINIVIRNQCVQYLNKLQLNGLEPTRLLEKSFNVIKQSFSVDISLLYSIPLNTNEIAIIWESLELDKAKATHIFKCDKSEYSEIFKEIELYLSTALKVRSSLNSISDNDIENQKRLRYKCRIEHDNFDNDITKWKLKLFEVIPELIDLKDNNSAASPL